MREYLKQFSQERGIIFGVCGAERLDDTRYSTFTPFVKSDVELRVNPRAVLQTAESVIVIGMGHGVPEYAARREPALPGGHVATTEAVSCGAVLSSLGVNEDYHKKIKSVLRELVSALQEKIPFKYKILADSATLDERALAVRAGLGFFGRNRTVISKEFGSFFNIGCLLTDIPVEILNGGDLTRTVESEQDDTLNNCGSNQRVESEQYDTLNTNPHHCPPDCFRCVNACPGGAITFDGNFHPQKCASYLTQKEGELTEAEIKIIGRNLYGCDICREVCPFNSHMPRTAASGVNPGEWLAMPDGELSQIYSHTAMAWRGAEILKRNAGAVISNLTR